MINNPFDTNSTNDCIPGNEQLPPIQKIIKTHFIQSDVRKYDLTLSRDTTSQQLKKICVKCRKGFLKRKGRAKAASIPNRPGRFICLQCANKLLNAEAKKPNKNHTQDDNDTLQPIQVIKNPGVVS